MRTTSSSYDCSSRTSRQRLALDGENAAREVVPRVVVVQVVRGLGLQVREVRLGSGHQTPVVGVCSGHRRVAAAGWAVEVTHHGGEQPQAQRQFLLLVRKVVIDVGHLQPAHDPRQGQPLADQGDQDDDEGDDQNHPALRERLAAGQGGGD